MEILRSVGIVPPQPRVLDDKRHSLDTYYSLPPNLREVLDETILGSAKRLFEELQAPQLVFGPDWLHMSLLVIIAAEGADLDPPLDTGKVDTNPYTEVIQEVLADHSPFEISFSRVVPFRGGIQLGGFPENSQVEEARQRLRSLLYSRGLPSFERRPLLQINHITLVRWDNAVTPPLTERVIEFTEGLDGKEFWRGKFDTVDFAIGGYNTSPENTTLLKRFKLK